MVKNMPANSQDIRDMVQSLGQEDSPVEGNGNPLQHPRLENPTDRGTWQTTVHGATRVGQN